jgi:hypothetical protein
MLITSDLKARLNPEFLANIISQLESSSIPPPTACCADQNERSLAMFEAEFEAGMAHGARARVGGAPDISAQSRSR